MLKTMTKAQFKEAIDKRQFVVKGLTATRYSVHLMKVRENGEFILYNVVNPDTKSGNFSQTGGGYSKAMACIEDIARYIDLESPKEIDPDFSCRDYLMKNQKWNEL
ncbi:MAG: hypothetical protein ABS939_02385 [Psychrobacillus sp.]